MAPKPIRENSAAPLTVAEAITEVIHRTVGRTIKGIAEDMNVPLSVLYDIADPFRERKLRAEELPALVLATGNPLVLDVIEDHVGRVAYPLPHGCTPRAEIAKLTGQSAKEFGVWLLEMSRAIAGDTLSQKDYERLRREGHELIATVCAAIDDAKLRVGR